MNHPPKHPNTETINIRQLAEKLVLKALHTNTVIALAESCTGGMIAAALTDIPGSSAVLDRGFVTYSNDAKMDVLGVSAACLDTHGAVSQNTALEMVAGTLAAAPNATLALSVTGIAGPDGGTAQKPVGLVHFACQSRAKAPLHAAHIFQGSRHEVRENSLKTALKMLFNELN